MKRTDYLYLECIEYPKGINIDLKENNIVFCLNKQGIYNVINVKVTRKYPILGIFNNYEYQCLEFNSPKANLSYSLLQTIVNKLNNLMHLYRAGIIKGNLKINLFKIF